MVSLRAVRLLLWEILSSPSLPRDVKNITAILLYISYCLHQSSVGYEQHFNTSICLDAFPSLTALVFFRSGTISNCPLPTKPSTSLGQHCQTSSNGYL